MPGDIIDILKRLRKADNIPHNQLYYIEENCADHYYSKVIKTFVALLKWQFADRQLLLINTARSLKFLEEYTDRQVLIWQIFRKHQNIPDDISDLHLHIAIFKVNIQKEFNFLKEVTCKNIENFQTSLNLQQTYSAAQQQDPTEDTTTPAAPTEVKGPPSSRLRSKMKQQHTSHKQEQPERNPTPMDPSECNPAEIKVNSIDITPKRYSWMKLTKFLSYSGKTISDSAPVSLP